MLKKYQSLVHQHIPITRYMEWQINYLSTSQVITLTRLEPNINVHATAFAGSLYASAMATGWTLMKCWYDSHGFSADLVAAEASIQYLSPVKTDFECIANLDQATPEYDQLLTRLQQNRSCGYLLPIEIQAEESVCAILSSQFVFKCRK